MDIGMIGATLAIAVWGLISLGIFALFIYLLILVIRALRVLRVENKMTQEFVAQTVGVSRQAVSKGESGASDPSTANLIALAKLYHTTVEEILRQVAPDTED